jgi:DNA-binding transcriptional MerR regulator
MSRTANRSYRTAEFAALAGVTSRALHHYDRLGLLKPKRSSAGYRLYSERDLEILEEIVALKFIGVPLKEIAAIRRSSGASFAERVRAQRQALQSKQSVLTRAIAAVAAVETALASGRPVGSELFRHITEVMQMDTNHETTVAKYVGLLRAKLSHLAAMSPEQRTILQGQWTDLIADVKAALGEDPAGPKGQALLNRWLSLLQAFTGTETTKVVDPSLLRTARAMSDEMWDRRAEWWPDGHRDDSMDATTARAHAFERAKSFADPDVLDFIARAREARR